MSRSVKVVCRFRTEKPQSLTGDSDPYDDWQFFSEEGTVKIRDKSFTYDALLNDCSQEDMYEKVARDTISEFMNGYNATIFAYGQSGSGKTFSMVGPDEINDQLALDFTSISPNIQELFGIIPRGTLQMFQTINELVMQGAECQVSCSYVEIYMEEITCLLSLKEKLKIKEYGDGIEVDGKKKIACKSPEDIFKVIAIGTKNKSVGGTLQNARSSRSHTLLVVEVLTKSVEGQEKKSKLNLIDLAGSEKTRNTGATGDRAKEAIKINLSLTSLNMVFMALTTPGENKYIPFKDSKLTRLLKDSLGGNALTTLLCTASKKVRYSDDTIGTLGFAQRAKQIKNKVKQNVAMGLKEYKYLVDALKNEIMILRSDLSKAGVPIHSITDKMVLQYLPNDAIGGENTTDGLSYCESRTDLEVRKRQSLIGLSENDIIIKYCELRAKFDNMKESAGRKISELSHQTLLIDDDELVRKLTDDLRDKDNVISDINSKLNTQKAKFEQMEKQISQLNKEKIQLSAEVESQKAENESNQEMLNLTMNDISELNSKLEKAVKKKKHYKSEKKKVSEDVKNFSTKINDLFEKVSQSEYANKVYELKIEDITRQNQDLLKQIEYMKESQKITKNGEEGLLSEISKVRENLCKETQEKEEIKKERDEFLRKLNDGENKLKIKETELSNVTAMLENAKKDYAKLKTDYSKLQTTYNELEEKKMIANSASDKKTIKNPVLMKTTNNIFGVLLKKTNKSFLATAKEDSKKTDEVLTNLFKDKVDELKKLRENILSMSPKTVSSRTTLEDLPDIDFEDEEGFLKMQALLAERDFQHQEEKEKKRKEEEHLKQIEEDSLKA